jgi:hypothetical protein
MSLTRVGDSVYLQVKTSGFVWEPAWDCYRPITAVSWDGERFVLDDRTYCADPTDPLYGYGTSEMHALCRELTRRFPPASAVPGSLPVIGPQEWLFDRYVSLSPCAPRDKASWKRLHKGKYRTPRSAPKSRLTRKVRRTQ